MTSFVVCKDGFFPSLNDPWLFVLPVVDGKSLKGDCASFSQCLDEPGGVTIYEATTSMHDNPLVGSKLDLGRLPILQLVSLKADHPSFISFGDASLVKITTANLAQLLKNEILGSSSNLITSIIPNSNKKILSISSLARQWTFL
jgi:hypothetical protein